MSIWTHVLASFRIDRIRPLQGELESIEKIIGKPEPYNPVEGEFYIPTGSEGSLEWSLWINPNINHMDAYTLTVFGDLRDYDNSESVIDWFKEVVKRSMLIRQAVCTIEVENHDTTTVTASSENGEPKFVLDTF